MFGPFNFYQIAGQKEGENPVEPGHDSVSIFSPCFLGGEIWDKRSLAGRPGTTASISRVGDSNPCPPKNDKEGVKEKIEDNVCKVRSLIHFHGGIL